MKRETASRTADSSAAQRAYHYLHGETPKVFEDPFALRLTSPGWRRIVCSRLGARLLGGVLYAWARPITAEHLARARYVDECLERAVAAGTTQFVILGAGMDSFALRRPVLCERLRVFEVDHPATQGNKRARVKDAGLKTPSTLTYVPVDFGRDSLEERLCEAGFSGTARTTFGWMGVTAYLSRESIAVTLGDIARLSAASSEVVFDFLEAGVFGDDARDVTTRKMLRFSARRGEPMGAAFELAELPTYLDALGFELVETLSPDEQLARWFQGRGDGLIPYRYAYFARARVR